MEPFPLSKTDPKSRRFHLCLSSLRQALRANRGHPHYFTGYGYYKPAPDATSISRTVTTKSWVCPTVPDCLKATSASLPYRWPDVRVPNPQFLSNRPWPWPYNPLPVHRISFSAIISIFSFTGRVKVIKRFYVWPAGISAICSIRSSASSMAPAPPLLQTSTIDALTPKELQYSLINSSSCGASVTNLLIATTGTRSNCLMFSICFCRFSIPPFQCLDPA